MLLCSLEKSGKNVVREKENKIFDILRGSEDLDKEMFIP